MKKYKIWLDNKTLVLVNEYQLFKDRWITYFGSIENVKDFIKNYKE
jgi:hypothetical protein